MTQTLRSVSDEREAEMGEVVKDIVVDLESKGASVVEICRLTGLTRVECQTILAASRGLQYTPPVRRMAVRTRPREWWIR